jgi:hypothetical protein
MPKTMAQIIIVLLVTFCAWGSADTGKVLLVGVLLARAML